nr:respiratory nitrate reductase subunit gamma [Geothermobacter ehrlichii]
MLFFLMIRRFVLKPEGLETTRDDYIIHSLLMLILFSGFIIEGLRIAATELDNNRLLAHYSPVGLLFAEIFASQQKETLEILHKIFWWGHFFLAAGFIAAIPHTKLRHIFTTSANNFFTDLRPKGIIGSIDLEDENIEQYEVAKITDLTWKDIFDTDLALSASAVRIAVRPIIPTNRYHRCSWSTSLAR